MSRRPLSVSVVGWIISILGGLAILGTLFSMSLMDDPRMQKAAEGNLLPLQVQLGLGVLSCVITLVSGINILGGKNWARLLYTICCGVMLVIGLVCSPSKITLIPSVLIQGTLILFLFLPKANAYLSPHRY